MRGGGAVEAYEGSQVPGRSAMSSGQGIPPRPPRPSTWVRDALLFRAGISPPDDAGDLGTGQPERLGDGTVRAALNRHRLDDGTVALVQLRQRPRAGVPVPSLHDPAALCLRAVVVGVGGPDLPVLPRPDAHVIPNRLRLRPREVDKVGEPLALLDRPRLATLHPRVDIVAHALGVGPEPDGMKEGHLPRARLDFLQEGGNHATGTKVLEDSGASGGSAVRNRSGWGGKAGGTGEHLERIRDGRIETITQDG